MNHIVSASQKKMKTTALHNGVAIPMLGCGTAVFDDIGPNQTNRSAAYAALIVQTAVNSGTRPLLIDMAAMYLNEEAIGIQLNKHLHASADASSAATAVVTADGYNPAEAPAATVVGIAREDLFVCTKIAHFNVGDHQACPYVEDPSLDAYAGATADIDGCIKRLGVGALDLCIIHWPARPDNTDEPLAISKRADIWRALEDAYTAKKCRAIGVSNFSVKHLEQLGKTLKIQPMVNQLEIHPKWQEDELMQACRDRGIHPMAYCPLGSGICSVLGTDVIKTIAAAHSTTPGAVVGAWHIQRGVTPVPKSTTPHRIVSNLTVPEFTLTVEEMASVGSLGAEPVRVCPDINTIL